MVYLHMVLLLSVSGLPLGLLIAQGKAFWRSCCDYASFNIESVRHRQCCAALGLLLSGLSTTWRRIVFRRLSSRTGPAHTEERAI